MDATRSNLRAAGFAASVSRMLRANGVSVVSGGAGKGMSGVRVRAFTPNAARVYVFTPDRADVERQVVATLRRLHWRYTLRDDCTLVYRTGASIDSTDERTGAPR